MRVLKFGGTSVANAERFIRVANILENNTSYGQVAAVLSAPAKITNYLVVMIKQILHGIDIRDTFKDTKNIFTALLNGLLKYQPRFDYPAMRILVDNEFTQLKQLLHTIFLLKQCPDSINATIICRGEKISVALMEAIFKARGFGVTIINPVVSLMAQEGGYLEAIIDLTESTRRILATTIPIKNIILMPGFTAGNKHGKLVVLGRNGSDYSAAVLAACLQADYCEIWTDVDGIYTCDPRQVPEAKLLRSISYREAMKLSYFGAKILHPRTIAPIAQFKIPCVIKNIINPQAPGTLIGLPSGK